MEKIDSALELGSRLKCLKSIKRSRVEPYKSDKSCFRQPTGEIGPSGENLPVAISGFNNNVEALRN